MQDSDRFGSIKFIKASEAAASNSIISMISKKRKSDSVEQDPGGMDADKIIIR